MSTTLTMTTTWDDVRAEWSKAQQMGHQAVLQAAKVGQMLLELSGDSPMREFVSRVKQELPGLNPSKISRLETLARNMPLIEEHRPQSQRQALALIEKAKSPSTPRRNPAAIAEIKREAAESRANYAAPNAKAQAAANDEVRDVVDGVAHEVCEQRGARDDVEAA